MKIAIISDSHNNQTNLAKVLKYCKVNSIKTIIHCGDLASPETLDFLNDNFSGKIYYALGNMDNEQLGKLTDMKTYKHTDIYQNFGELEIEEHKLALTHFPREAKSLAKSGKYEIIFYGHTHKPWIETIGKTTMLNPGNVAGEIFLPTFAVWETETNKFELVRIT